VVSDHTKVRNALTLHGLTGRLELIVPLEGRLLALMQAELTEFNLRVHHTVVHLPPPGSTTVA
jgi:hypothetical protein